MPLSGSDVAPRPLATLSEKERKSMPAAQRKLLSDFTENHITAARPRRSLSIAPVQVALRRPAKRSAAVAFGAAYAALAADQQAADAAAPIQGAKRSVADATTESKPVAAAAASEINPDLARTEKEEKRMIRLQKTLQADLTESFAGPATPGQRRAARDAAAAALQQEKRKKKKREEEKERRLSIRVKIEIEDTETAADAATGPVDAAAAVAAAVPAAVAADFPNLPSTSDDLPQTEEQPKKIPRALKMLKSDVTEKIDSKIAPGQRRLSREAAINALQQEKMEKRKKEEEREKRQSMESNHSGRSKKENELWLPSLDRSSETLWDKQLDSLRMMRKEIDEEDVIFGDYYEAYRAYAEDLLEQEAQLLGKEYDPMTSKKHFWFKEFKLDNRSDASHSSLSCSKLRRMTVEHVKSALRFIKIGAMCEKCVNPFALPQKSLDKVAPRCTCAKPAVPAFKVNERSEENIPQGRAKEEMMEEDWDENCKIQEKKSRRGIKAQLIREIGEDAFKKLYPLFRVALEKRTDEFGRAVYQKQQALHALRRANNQPPTFLMSWTSKKEGDAYLPEEWILDGTWELSEGAKKILNGKKGAVAHLKCSCTNNCASGNCCSSKMLSIWKVNENGILTQKNGLGPCGTEGDSIRQPHETDNVQVGICGPDCGCDLSCPRRFSDRGSQSMKIIFMTHTKGWSVRTVEPMVRGEYILSFSGVISTQNELKANNENLEMVLDIAQSKRAAWKNRLTIATDARSNEFRCINHSCAPNSLIVTTHSRKWGEQMHGTSLFSRRALNAFEEITFDYYLPGDTFRFDCQCGAYCCRGIKGDDIKV